MSTAGGAHQVYVVHTEEEAAQLQTFLGMCTDYEVPVEERGTLWEMWTCGGHDYLDELFEEWCEAQEEALLSDEA